MKLVLMGPPGAGKGTQGELLVQWLGSPKFSTGDMLRDARGSGSDLGRRAAGYMDAGELVPDDVILGIIKEALDRDDAWNGFVLDGFPRTVAQAQGLEELLAERGLSLDAVVQLQVAEEELVERLGRRRVCVSCAEITQRSETSGGECLVCGGELVQRGDDRSETVRRRLQVFGETTQPVLRWYRSTGVPVLDVDGTGSVADIHAAIRHRLTA